MSAQAYPLWSADSPPVLLASRDRETGERIFPAVPDASPLAPRHDLVPVTGEGVLYSFTVIHPSPKSGQPPFALGYVDFPAVKGLARDMGEDRDYNALRSAGISSRITGDGEAEFTLRVVVK